LVKMEHPIPFGPHANRVSGIDQLSDGSIKF
jgi:hypothetical protein